jgi:hypothetical protein
MQVEIVTVDIPAAYSRRWQVPKYDIACLELLWPAAKLMPDRQITAMPTGVVEDRFMEAEYDRIRLTYHHPVGGVPVFRRAYPSKDAFREAFEASEWHPPVAPADVQVAMEVDRRLAAINAENAAIAERNAQREDGAIEAQHDTSLPALDELVDDRSLPELAAIGITDTAGLVTALVEKDDRVLDVKYLTEKRLAAILDRIGIE